MSQQRYKRCAHATCVAPPDPGRSRNQQRHNGWAYDTRKYCDALQTVNAGAAILASENAKCWSLDQQLSAQARPPYRRASDPRRRYERLHRTRHTRERSRDINVNKEAGLGHQPNCATETSWVTYVFGNDQTTGEIMPCKDRHFVLFL